MNTIVFYNEKRTVELENSIISHIQHKFGSSKSTFINFVFTDNLKNITFSDYVLIIGDTIRASNVKYISDTARIIVNAESIKCLKRLAGCKGKVYTCGYSDKDFVTFSSHDGNRAVVSLQRNIRVGNILYEPFELPCEIEQGHTDYSVLASVLSLVLLQIIPE